MSDSVEEWKPVVGFEDTFLISSHGRIRRIKTRYGNPQNKFLVGFVTTSGYPAAELQVAPPRIRAYLHALVAEAFIGPRPAGHQVNHIDGIKTNNHVSNLEYVTPRENLNHAGRLGLIYRRVTPNIVREVRASYAATGSYKPMVDKYGLDTPRIWRIVTRQSWPDID